MKDFNFHKNAKKTHPDWDSNPEPLDKQRDLSQPPKRPVFRRSLTRYHCATGTVLNTA